MEYRTVERTLLELDEIPLLGGEPPPFPGKELAETLKSLFELETLEIEVSPPQWSEERPQGLQLNFACLPLETTFAFALPEEGLKTLMKHCLKADDFAIALYDSPLQQGFLRFLAIEVIRALQGHGFPPGLAIHLNGDKALPPGPWLHVDLNFTLEGNIASGRLVLPGPFLQGWRAHYAGKRAISPELAATLPLSLNAEAGRALLSHQEWASVSVGDFIALDTCTFNPHECSGSLALTLEGRPLFTGLFTDEGITIQTKTEATMDEDYDEDFSLEEEEEETIEEELPIAEEEVAEEAPLEEESDREAEPEAAPEPEPLVPAGEIPVTINVEVGRIKMSAEKVLALQPGNTLDLNVPADARVDLVVGGKRVGRGELLQIGDVMGVRVLELG